VALVVERVLPLFQKLGDELGLARAWHLLGEVRVCESRESASSNAFERALLHARRAGHQQEEEQLLCGLTGAHGSTPAEDAISRCEQIFDQAEGQRYVQATMLYKLALLHAMLGRFAEGREFYRRAKAITEDLGQKFGVAGMTQFAGELEMLADDPAAAEHELRWGYEALAEMGGRGPSLEHGRAAS
jgi:hypothetical protein